MVGVGGSPGEHDAEQGEEDDEQREERDDEAVCLKFAGRPSCGSSTSKTGQSSVRARFPRR